MGPNLYHVEPLEGFTPRIGRYLAQMDDVSARVRRYVDGLTSAQLDWHPNDKCESIGTLLLHNAAAERSWIGEDILRNPMSEEEWKYAFPIRLNIPQISGMSLEYYLTIMNRTREESKAALRELTDDDLSREIVPLDAGEGNDSKKFTIEWILYHLVEHEAHHKGQIALMKRLLPA